ncbi:MAG: lipopolysaccharide assembly protein LapA domain-containing protein [Leptolyngbyaceae cyanobacterium]
MRLYVVSALLIAFLAILFALQNTNLVTIQFFIWEYQQSQALILLGSLAIGVIIGLLVSIPAVIRRNVRVSRLQQQTENLTQQIEDKAAAVRSEAEKNQAVKLNYEELLNSLDILEPTTGLIRHRLLSKAIAAQLARLQKQADVAQVPPYSVLQLKVVPVVENGSSLPEMFAAVANTLQQQALPQTWFYSDGQGQFAATNAGMDTKAITHYGEKLQAAILENPPVLSTGQTMEMDVSVGGAIADSVNATSSDDLLLTADKALEQALQRGRNRVRILSTT